MTLGTQNLRDQITTRLAVSPVGLACCQLEGALTILNAASVTCVANLAALPNVVDNQGRFFFVEDIGAYRYSNGEIYTNDYDTTVGSVESAGVLLTWGNNTGDPLVSGRSSPGTTAGGGATWCQVSMRHLNSIPNHAGAVKTDGTLWMWAGLGVAGGSGELGDGTTCNRTSPVTTAGGGFTWCVIVAGAASSGAIKTDGTLWTWGNGIYGRLGTDSTLNRSSPGTTSGGGTNWCALAGTYAWQALKTDGTLWTWGANSQGRLGDDSVINRSSPITTAGGGTTWCGLGGGSSTNGAVKTDGTLWTWGFNGRGQLGDGTVTSRSSPGTTAGGGADWCAISNGQQHTAAIKTDGTAWTWGYNATGRLGDGTVLSRSSPGTTSGGGTTWCAISAGGAHTAAVKTDGTLWSWGSVPGDGTVIARSSPVTPAGGGTTWCQVTANFASTAGIQTFNKGFAQP